MKYSFLKFLFILPFLLFPIKSFGVQVDIQDISDDKYFQAVHKELANAAVFYMLSKKTRIPHFLLKYNGFNEFEYIGRRRRPVLTAGFGSNFNLDKRLEMEIRKRGFYWKIR